jgi:5-methylthioribose kinase
MALKTMHRLLPADAVVTVPQLFHHDLAAHVLIMEDCGAHSRTLKALLLDSDPATALAVEDARHLGTALGRLLAVVHADASKDDALMQCVRRHEEGKRICAAATYGVLVDTLAGTRAQVGFATMRPCGEGLTKQDVEDVRIIAETTTQAILDAQNVFTMGDFWAGNIVVRTDAAGRIERAFVVDWEVAKPGLPFLDFGQFVAEMHLPRLFYPHSAASVHEALDAFAKAYRERINMDDVYMRGVVAHVGTHLLAWVPFVPDWKPMDRVAEVMKEGVKYLLESRRGNVDSFKSSPIGDVF